MSTPSTSGSWDRADLARRLCGVLDVAERALVRLAPSGYTDPIDPACSVRPEKLVSETALLLLGASRVQGVPAVRTRVDRIARQLVPHARGARLRSGLCLEPSLALDYGLAHACLSRLGFADAGFDELLAGAAQAQAFAVRERPAHRMLEQHWVAGLAGLPARLAGPTVSALASMSALGRPLDLVGGSREDLYAFTHALIYLTDPNLPRRRLPRPRAAIVADAEAALARCLDEEDYDLAGELLLTWPLTGARWTPAANFAFRTLAWVEDEAGFLPSAGTRLAHLSRLEPDQRSDGLMASAYHTVYVMGLVCAACLAHDSLPAAAPRVREAVGATGAGDASIADALCPAPAASSGAPHWVGLYHAAEPGARAPLASFMLSIALRRAIRRRDLAGAHALLVSAMDAGLADGPLCCQTAELIQRAAAASAAMVVSAAASSAAMPAIGPAGTGRVALRSNAPG